MRVQGHNAIFMEDWAVKCSLCGTLIVRGMGRKGQHCIWYLDVRVVKDATREDEANFVVEWIGSWEVCS